MRLTCLPSLRFSWLPISYRYITAHATYETCLLYANSTGCPPTACQVQSGMPGSPVAVRTGASLLGRRLLPRVRRSLWSADVPTCVVPRTLSSYGDRTFAAAGPRLWHSLPVQLRNPDITYGLFRRQLKGHFFGNHEHGALWLLMCWRHRKTLNLLTSWRWLLTI